MGTRKGKGGKALAAVKSKLLLLEEFVSHVDGVASASVVSVVVLHSRRRTLTACTCGGPSYVMSIPYLARAGGMWSDLQRGLTLSDLHTSAGLVPLWALERLVDFVNRTLGVRR